LISSGDRKVAEFIADVKITSFGGGKYDLA